MVEMRPFLGWRNGKWNRGKNCNTISSSWLYLHYQVAQQLTLSVNVRGSRDPFPGGSCDISLINAFGLSWFKKIKLRYAQGHISLGLAVEYVIFALILRNK